MNVTRTPTFADPGGSTDVQTPLVAMCARAEEGTSRLLTDDPVSVSMTSLSTLKALTQGGTLRSMF